MRIPEATLPHIDVVIIGLNSARDVGHCIEAVLASDYDTQKLHLYYVDGGSGDRSVEIARGYAGVTVIELDNPRPTPGRGRNAGYRAGRSTFVQFLDSDSYVEHGWFRSAVSRVSGRVGALSGLIYERRPYKNWFHRVSDLDWRFVEGREQSEDAPREARVFAGNVLVRRQALVDTGGYDESLVAGEEADLSYRLRLNGWQIYGLPEAMASHDICLDHFRTYTRRAVRSGYAYAEIAFRYVRCEERLFLQRVVRVVVSAAVPLCIAAVFVGIGRPYLGFLLALAVGLRSLRKLFAFRREHGIGTIEGLLYGLHLSYVVYPQFAGVVRFVFGRLLGRPMRNESQTQGKSVSLS